MEEGIVNAIKHSHAREVLQHIMNLYRCHPLLIFIVPNQVRILKISVLTVSIIGSHHRMIFLTAAVHSLVHPQTFLIAKQMIKSTVSGYVF